MISLFIAARKIGTRGGRNDISTVIRTAAVGREMSDNIRHNRQNEDRLDKRCRDNIPTDIWTRTMKKNIGMLGCQPIGGGRKYGGGRL